VQGNNDGVIQSIYSFNLTVLMDISVEPSSLLGMISLKEHEILEYVLTKLEDRSPESPLVE
jgi:hypothetical protein